MIPPRRIKMEGTTKIMKWKPERKFIKKNSLTQEGKTSLYDKVQFDSK